ncbi:hypothetical protein GCM10027051_12900 [Niabella terrae]
MKAVIGIILLAVTACKTGPAPTSIPATPLALKIDQQQQLGGLQLTVKEIRESRCPMNARCIRAGEAIAMINVLQQDKERNIQLCSGADCRRAGLGSTYTLNEGELKYLFQLDSITPDPGKTLVRSEKVVHFTVSQIR